MENFFVRRSVVFLHSAFNTCSPVCYNSFQIKRNSSVNVVYKIYGEGTSGFSNPIIILHGLLGNKKNWHSMATKIQNSISKVVITVDQRNHGESPHVSSHTYHDLAGDVSALMSTLSVKTAIVMGHSMGGRAAMTLALTQPALLSGLIVVDISPLSFPSVGDDSFVRIMEMLSSIQFASKDAASARQEARKIIQKSGLVENPGFMNFILTNVGKRGDKIGWNVNCQVLKQYYGNVVKFPADLAGKKYEGPTLFIGGDQSDFLPPCCPYLYAKSGFGVALSVTRNSAYTIVGKGASDETGIKEIFPAAKLVILKGAGHNVHADKPDEMLKLIDEFIKSVN